MRPLIIGQAPGPNTDPALPLSGRCGERLAWLCGLPTAEFRERFDLINLLPRFPGKAGKGDKFPIGLAREIACGLLMKVNMRDRRIVLLGGNVARAFYLPASVDVLVWLPDLTVERLAVSPHPSGVSRWWNDPSNVARAARFWRRLARGAA